MATAPFVTALIGFGKMGQGYAADPMMARHFRYAAHAQVLQAHPAFDWQAVVDTAPDAREAARRQWQVAHCAANLAELGPLAERIEVAVLATNPDARLGFLEQMPRLRAVLVEKPLGRDLPAARDFLDACARRDILVQVNLWRRADALFRRLAAGELIERIGEPQAATCYYGNGLLNNGTHMIDFARMLFGEVVAVQLIGRDTGSVEGPLPGDRNPHFAVWTQHGLVIDFQPLRFTDFRENGMIVWGRKGRLDILAEGLVVQQFPAASHRAMLDEREVAVDAPEPIESTVGVALYEMFDNLADALHRHPPATLLSTGDSAFTTSRIVDLVAALGPERRLLTA